MTKILTFAFLFLFFLLPCAFCVFLYGCSSWHVGHIPVIVPAEVYQFLYTVGFDSLKRHWVPKGGSTSICVPTLCRTSPFSGTSIRTVPTSQGETYPCINVFFTIRGSVWPGITFPHRAEGEFSICSFTDRIWPIPCMTEKLRIPVRSQRNGWKPSIGILHPGRPVSSRLSTRPENLFLSG